MSDILHGYLGFSKYPNRISNSSSTIYCISDASRGEVFIIPLTIGCFPDMYNLISDLILSGSKIRILPLSIQYDYISDIYNIVTLFKAMDADIKWVFPDSPVYYYSEQFETSQEKFSSYSNEVEPSLTIAFIDSGVKDLYDIQVMTPQFTKYFTLYLTEDKINSLMMNDSINEVHIDSYKSRHGGIDAFDLISLNKLNKKINVFNLRNKADYVYFKRLSAIGYDKERWNTL